MTAADRNDVLTRARLRMRMAAITAIGAVMVLVPAMRVGGDMEHLGWHMFARTSEMPDFAVERSDGALEEVDAGDHVAAGRGELDYAGPVARRICAVDADAVAVHVSYDSGEAEVVACDG